MSVQKRGRIVGFMDERELDIPSLELKISMLRREERRLLVVIGDEAISTRARRKARTELREISLAIIRASHDVRKLEVRR